MTQITVDAERCDSCNLCLAACSRGGLVLKDGGIFQTDEFDCRECRTCEYICARGAITWGYEIVLGNPA